METNMQLYQTGTTSKTIYDRTILYLSEKYDLRFNTISLELEIRVKNGFNFWSGLNINSLLIELVQAGIEISMSKLEILVKSHLIEQYNPLKEYFVNLPKWDEVDHIAKLCSYLKTNDDKAFCYHFEKWITRAVVCALKDDYVNKQCFVLTSGQNTGKSYFLRFLIPKSLEAYYTENLSVDKDGIIAICKNLLCNLDELAVLSKSDVNTLKSFISKNSANVRLPYARKAEFLQRICSFVGSTNRLDFLTDETGSVRWLIFDVLKIDFNYSSKIDINKVWAQAFYNAFERKNYNPELTAQDVIENEIRNECYREISIEEEVALEHFENGKSQSDFLTPSDIKLAMENALGLKLNRVNIGKALTKLKYQRIKHPKRQVYGYVIRRKT